MERRLREIVLDTETTGLSCHDHRIIEIGCVELINRIPTGIYFHEYINPERDIPYHATKIHGITLAALQDKPLFAQILEKFRDFISNDPLIIHNSEFDVRFLNMEFQRIDKTMSICNPIIDTLSIARKKFAGSPATLDALCKRFNIVLDGRTKHGALIDAELLAKVYVELMGGLQLKMKLSEANKTDEDEKKNSRKYYPTRSFVIPEDERERHRAFCKKIKDPIWHMIKDPI